MCSKENNRLADEITELACHIHAATCRWLGLVAEFDTRGGWGEWGCRSCSHWLSWRCSISPVAAREHVRVAHRLEELPLIRGAFAEGRLSYSQVRALTRVENVEREEELLSLARHATAAQLERLVRAYHGVVARARVAAGGGPDRYVTWDHADDGSLLLRARLPAEEGAVVLAALQAAVERGASAEASVIESAPVEAASADALAAAPASAGVAAVEAASAEALADGPVCAGAPAVEAASAEAHADGTVSADAHPAVPVSAEAHPAVPVSAEAHPAVPVSAEAAAADRKSHDARSDFNAAEAPASESAEAPSFQDASAEAPSLRERRADALVLMADTLLANEPNGRGGDRFQVVVHVDVMTLRDGDGESELADGAPIDGETARRLACDSAIVPLLERAGRPLGVGRKTRSVPPALRRALASRDRGCRFRAARATARSTPTTSSTGRTAARRTWRTSCSSAAITTGCCTRAATRSPRPDRGSCSAVRTAARSERSRGSPAAAAARCRSRTCVTAMRSTPRRPSRCGQASGSTSDTTSTRC